jgi:type 1 fimbria pilin
MTRQRRLRAAPARFRLAAAALAAFAAGAAAAAPAASPVAGTASLTMKFLPADTAMHTTSAATAQLDFGRVSAAAFPRKGPLIVRQRIALLLEGAGAAARVSVALDADMPGSTIRVDGQPISAIPRVIAPVHRVNVPVTHDIEIQIPPNAPAGPYLTNLQWSAQTD